MAPGYTTDSRMLRCSGVIASALGAAVTFVLFVGVNSALTRPTTLGSGLAGFPEQAAASSSLAADRDTYFDTAADPLADSDFDVTRNPHVTPAVRFETLAIGRCPFRIGGSNRFVGSGT